MNLRIAALTLALACGSAAFVSTVQAQPAPAHGGGHLMVKPGELTWKPLPSIAGADIAVIEGPMSQPGPFTVRLRLPANSRIPPHWHPGIEHMTVMSGTFYIGHGEKFEEGKLMALPPGSVAIMQPKSPHFVLAKEETIVQLHGMGPWSVNYINPADDPSKK
ncbi:cupin domain-containing protein [Caldimonas tepidiphila]|uniref:cupin domain-containing protein n=1 Tax=Caldimonas tepidiphila TaxID=2315841 RepID=UPI0013006A9A|nr:cupin domain-containing protein [Caldimonas tepidiphila]